MKDYLATKNIKIFTDETRVNCIGKYGLTSYNKLDGDRKRDMSEWIISVGLHPGYIKGIDWIRVQELILKNSEKDIELIAKNEALLSGILRCKECGSYMRPKATGNQPKTALKKRFYYTCELKDRSKGTKCHGENIVGLKIDSLIVDKLNEIFVPNSAIYEELKKISLSKNKIDKSDEIANLDKAYNKNLDAIKKLVDKLKYMDIEVVDFVNDELKRLKKENEGIQEQIKKLQMADSEEKITATSESKGADLILNIVNNCINTFDTLDIKLKKDILKLLIKDIVGNGDKVEVNMLNTKIEDSTKIVFRFYSGKQF